MSMLTIQNPNPPVECGSTEFQWSGGSPPYTLQLAFHNNSSLLQQFDNLNGTSMSWVANVTAGTQIFLRLLDETRLPEGVSGSFQVQNGDDSCLREAVSSTSLSSTGAHMSNPLFPNCCTNVDSVQTPLHQLTQAHSYPLVHYRRAARLHVISE